MIRKLELKRIIPWLWMVIGLTLDGWYHFVHGKEMIDSDTSAEMILANILNNEHSITGLTKSWFYSTEIRIISVQWPFRLGLLLFPDNWHMARSVGIMLMIVSMAFAAGLFMHMIGYDEYIPWTAALVVFPGGGWYFWLTIFYGTYIPYIVLSFISMGLIILIIRSDRSKKTYIYLFLTVLTGVLSGLAGVRQVMVFYGPVVLTAIILFCLDFLRENRESYKLKFLVVSIIGCFSSFAGYLINSCVLQKIYCFRSFDDRAIGYGNSFFDYLRYYTWSFGFKDVSIMMSPQGVASMCGLVFGVIVLISGALLVMRFNSLEQGEQILAASFVSCIVFDCFIFSYINGGDLQYLQSAVPLGYCLVIMAIKTGRVSFENSRFILINVVTAILFIASIGTLYNEFHGPIHQYRAKPGLAKVVDMLRDEGYTAGISKFWTANIVTELSDGEMEMFILGNENEQWEEWLEPADHVGRYPAEPYFYIYETPEKDGFEDHKAELDEAFRGEHPELKQIYEDDRYTVYATGK